jgi:hypothetical protein
MTSEVLSGSCESTGDCLVRAIRATFARHNTPIPTALPDALTSAFANESGKQKPIHLF